MTAAAPRDAITGGVAVLVPAAGRGARMGGVKKAFLELAGVPVLLRAVRPFLRRKDVGAVVVALAQEDADDPPDWLVADPRVHVVAGGATRGESVRAALAAAPEQCDIVVIHDGARPLVADDVIERCIREARAGKGAVAGVPATDTLKRVDDRGRILDTPDRATLWHAQTPQAFPRSVLVASYEAAPSDGPEPTDDAMLVESAGFDVVVVEADPSNLKITHERDLVAAALILNGGPL